MNVAPTPAAPDVLSSSADMMLRNPFWHALATVHACFAVDAGPPGSAWARRYPAEILPFAAVAEPSAPALSALAALLAPGETIFITDLDDAPPGPVPELAYVSLLPGLQMILSPQPPSLSPEASPEHAIRRLEAEDGPSMLALKEIAFPGYFGRNTVRLGVYYGIHHGGKLIAMAGERAAFPGFCELSAVCTHPCHRGKGHAAALMRRLMRDHAAAGLRSILHVGAANGSAIRLYEQLGFEPVRPIFFHQLRRL